MTTIFESAVYLREHQTPWARVDPFRFMKDMVWHGADDPLNNAVLLKVHYRHDVASRCWWSLEWTGPDGQRHEVEAQHVDKLLWRAAEIESQAEAKRSEP